MQKDYRKELQWLLEQEIQRELAEAKKTETKQAFAMQSEDPTTQNTSSQFYEYEPQPIAEDMRAAEVQDNEEQSEAPIKRAPEKKEPLVLQETQFYWAKEQMESSSTKAAATQESDTAVQTVSAGKQPRKKTRIVFVLLIAAVFLVALGTLGYQYSATVQGAGQTGGIEKEAVVLYRPFSNVSRWDVVITRDGEVGRVVGLPNEWIHVQGETGQLYINNALMDEAEGIIYGENIDKMKEPMRIPEDSVYLLGDDRTVTMGKLILKTELLGSIFWPILKR